jgi:hypothetical protein
MVQALSDGEKTQILKDVQARLQEMPNKEGLAKLVEEQVKAVLKSYEEAHPSVRRKIVFGDAAPEVLGSKFARWGYSVADIEFLHDLMQGCKGRQLRMGGSEAGLHPGPSEDLTKAFKAVSDAYYLPMEEVRRIDKAAIDGLFPRVNKHNVKAFDAAMKAMDTAETGFGLQLVGTQYVGELWEAARLQSRIFATIPTFEMQHPTAQLPIMQAFPEMLFVSESTANNSANYDTSKTGSNRVQVDAKKFVVHQMWSGEMDEDSIIPFVPFIRLELQNSLGHYSDSVVLNGDATNAGTGNINLDDADPADTKHYLAFDGIRHVGIVDNTANSKDIAGAISRTEFLLAQGRMVDTSVGKYFFWGFPLDPMDLIHAMDFETYIRVVDLNETTTVDKMGPQATILTGQLASINGHPIIVSPAMSKTEADGKVSTTGANNTKGQIATYNRRGFVVGWRRRVQIETERLPATDQTRIVASLRLGFGRFAHTAASIESADVMRNITV